MGKKSESWAREKEVMFYLVACPTLEREYVLNIIKETSKLSTVVFSIYIFICTMDALNCRKLLLKYASPKLKCPTS